MQQYRTSGGKQHVVRGGGGLELHAREWGNPAGRPILFIHGWSQSLVCWANQYHSSLAKEFRLVAFDNRGHGLSGKPLEAEHYHDAALWADDVAAVIDQLRMERPVLVGWSYGGFIVCDYLRQHGQDAVSGIDLVCAAVTLHESAFGTLIGPGFLEPFSDATSLDLAANIDGMRRFVRHCTAEPLSQDELEVVLAWNMAVPPQVRGHLGSRKINSDDVLTSLNLPVLVTHGREDSVVLPETAEHVLKVCPSAEPSWYDGIGHSPHIEAPARFNEELSALVRRAR